MGGRDGDVVRVKKAGRGVEAVLKDRKLKMAIRAAYKEHRRVKQGEPGLKAARAYITRCAHRLLREDGGSVTFFLGGLTLSVRPRHAAYVEAEDVRELRRLLGPRFKDLVREKTIYSGSAALMKDPGLRRFVRLKEISPSFRWGG